MSQAGTAQLPLSGNAHMQLSPLGTPGGQLPAARLTSLTPLDAPTIHSMLQGIDLPVRSLLAEALHSAWSSMSVQRLWYPHSGTAFTRGALLQ